MKVTDIQIEELNFDEEYDNQAKSFFASITCFKHIKKIENVHKITVGDNIFYCSIRDYVELYVAMRKIDNDVLDTLLDYFFNTYDIKYVFIDHLYNDYKTNKYIPIQTGINSDVIMDIPGNIDEYNSLLGKKTRKHLRYYINRLEKQFDKVEYQIYKNQDISFDLIDKMYVYNSNRLEKIKNIRRSYNQNEVYDTFCCAKDNGILFVLYLDETPQAISLIQNIGGDYYLTDIGSNIDFDEYNIGQVNLFKTIEYSINNKQNEESKYHFMFEITDYKKRFGGTMVELYPYIVYKKINLSFIFDYSKYGLSTNLIRIVKRNDEVKKVINKVRKLLNK